MTILNTGFDGTIDETSFAGIMRSAGVKSSFSTRDAYRVTAVGDGTRRVKFLGGRAYAAGVTQDSDETQYATIPAPAAAGWFLVVLRRDWSNNTITVKVLAGATQTSTTPTVVPDMPTDFTQTPGVLWDQELAWVFSTLGSTSYTIVDLRPQMLGVPKVGNANDRNLYYVGRTDSFAARVQLQGSEWYRSDVGYLERYFAENDPTYNPNGGCNVAGWYPIEGQLPKTRLTRSAKQSIPNASTGGTPFSWDGYTYRVGTWVQTSGAITVPQSGFYRVFCQISYEGHADTKRRQVRFVRNGIYQWSSTSAGNDTAALQPTTASLYWEGYLAAGDTVGFEAGQNSGATLDIAADATFVQISYDSPM